MTMRTDSQPKLMPTYLADHTGPRCKPSGERYIYDAPTRIDRYLAAYEVSNLDGLLDLLPEGVSMRSPSVIVSIDYLSSIEWLGGAGYRIASCLVPVSVETDEGAMNGMYMPFLWEDRVDPIITGREQLGWNKLYGNISSPVSQPKGEAITVSQYGSSFLNMSLDFRKFPRSPLKFLSTIRQGDGIFHHRRATRSEYPFFGNDIDCLTFSPSKPVLPKSGFALPKDVIKFGSADIHWMNKSQHESPCNFELINLMNTIGVKKVYGAIFMKTFLANDQFDQRIVKRY